MGGFSSHSLRAEIASSHNINCQQTPRVRWSTVTNRLLPYLLITIKGECKHAKTQKRCLLCSRNLPQEKGKLILRKPEATIYSMVQHKHHCYPSQLRYFICCGMLQEAEPRSRSPPRHITNKWSSVRTSLGHWMVPYTSLHRPRLLHPRSSFVLEIGC